LRIEDETVRLAIENGCRDTRIVRFNIENVCFDIDLASLF
jgi:hypothetical protein